ncbi:unnamed protein product [Didymodactylos carnosus]|uniref:Uncharacterized protein n=1 Tax=Didymodactylos carnosus TaxID=1234261 RepID=A0A8S2D5L4_9BILA|nr:unnamed protein product [Didymodactylos carnosus]CAF3667225.1 unnamed protein product [Didymodactylos carnosus]
MSLYIVELTDDQLWRFQLYEKFGTNLSMLYHLNLLMKESEEIKSERIKKIMLEEFGIYYRTKEILRLNEIFEDHPEIKFYDKHEALVLLQEHPPKDSHCSDAMQTYDPRCSLQFRKQSVYIVFLLTTFSFFWLENEVAMDTAGYSVLPEYQKIVPKRFEECSSSSETSSDDYVIAEALHDVVTKIGRVGLSSPVLQVSGPSLTTTLDSIIHHPLSSLLPRGAVVASSQSLPLMKTIDEVKAEITEIIKLDPLPPNIKDICKKILLIDSVIITRSSLEYYYRRSSAKNRDKALDTLEKRGLLRRGFFLSNKQQITEAWIKIPPAEIDSPVKLIIQPRLDEFQITVKDYIEKCRKIDSSQWGKSYVSKECADLLVKPPYKALSIPIHLESIRVPRQNKYRKLLEIAKEQFAPHSNIQAPSISTSSDQTTPVILQSADASISVFYESRTTRSAKRPLENENDGATGVKQARKT